MTVLFCTIIYANTCQDTGREFRNCISEELKIMICKNNCRKTFELALKKASNNDATGRRQFIVATMYHNGWGTTKNLLAAIKWYKKAASKAADDQDHFATNVNIVNMGNAYEELMDYVTAFKLYKQAAMNGNALAQAELGRMYAYGRGIPRNMEEAYAWYSIASAQGVNYDEYQKEIESARDYLEDFLVKEGTLSNGRSLSEKYFKKYILHE